MSRERKRNRVESHSGSDSSSELHGERKAVNWQFACLQPARAKCHRQLMLPLLWLQREFPIAKKVWIPSFESGLCIGYFTKPLSRNASLCAWTTVILGKDQCENNQYLLPNNILSVVNSIGRGTPGLSGGFAAPNPHQDNSQNPRWLLLHGRILCAWNIPASMTWASSVLPFKSHKDVWRQFRKLLTSF